MCEYLQIIQLISSCICSDKSDVKYPYFFYIYMNYVPYSTIEML